MEEPALSEAAQETLRPCGSARHDPQPPLWIKDTGFRSDFCSNCGSPVPNPLNGRPYFWVPAGLLEGDVQLKISAHLFVGSKASWDVITSAEKQYETMPELSELLRPDAGA